MRKTIFLFAFFGLGLSFTAAVGDDSPTLTPAQQQAAAQASVEQAQATADKAKWDAATAKATYLSGAFPASTVTGAVTTKDNAGQAEATLLTARSINAVSAGIVGDIVDKTGAAKSVMIFADADTPQISAWDMFSFRTDALGEAFDDAIKAYGDVPTIKDRAQRGLSTTADLTGVGEVVSSVTKLIGYFMANYEIGGVTVSTDDAMMVAAVADQLSRQAGYSVFISGKLPAATAAAEVRAVLKQLDEKNLTAKRELKSATDISAAEQKIADSDKSSAEEKAAAKAVVDSFKTPIDMLTTVTTAYQTLLTNLANTDDKTQALGVVIQGRAVADALGTNGYGLFVHVQYGGGGYYTKHTLWNAFGGMPYYVSGGSVVRFYLIGRSDGKLADAGLVGCYGGYVKLDDMGKELRTTLTCPR